MIRKILSDNATGATTIRNGDLICQRIARKTRQKTDYSSNVYLLDPRGASFPLRGGR